MRVSLHPPLVECVAGALGWLTQHAARNQQPFDFAHHEGRCAARKKLVKKRPQLVIKEPYAAAFGAFLHRLSGAILRGFLRSAQNSPFLFEVIPRCCLRDTNVASGRLLRPCLNCSILRRHLEPLVGHFRDRSKSAAMAVKKRNALGQ
jgi:hypothetical protein